jgi:hypothetical protein
MTGLLTDLMHERADGLEHLDLDVHRLVRAGDRRVRRRRAVAVAGAAALAVVAAVSVPMVLGGEDAPTAVDPDLVAAFAGHAPSFAVGSDITIDGATFDVGHTVRAYVQTDVGAVFSDPDGVVWAADGAEVAEVGRINAKIPHLVADGHRVAWVEPGEIPTFTVFDQATGETVHDSLLNTAGMSDVRDGKDAAVVYAVDGDVVYVKNREGAVAWDTSTGDLTILDTEADGFTIADAKNGLIAYTRSGQRDRYFIGPDLQSGREFDLYLDFLSPDARYVMAELPEDSVTVLDTSTGTQMPHLNPRDYTYWGAYQWLDGDHYAALGFTSTTEDATADIYTCTVTSGDCELVAEDAGSLADGLVIPLGVRLD